MKVVGTSIRLSRRLRRVGGLFFHPTLRIVDVTDPTDPTVVKDIEYPMDGNMSQITSQGDLLMVGMARELTQYDTQNAINFMSEFQPEEVPADKLKYEGVLLFDISDPVNPVELSHWETGAYGVHRNILHDGYAYISASAPGYRAQILKILDVRDPKTPSKLASGRNLVSVWVKSVRMA